MHFESDYIYHVYNQGNNRQRIFFNRDNYVFFLNKIQKHILPFSDILAWCLMPNHFHLMVYVNAVELLLDATDGVTAHQASALGSHPVSKPITFNNSIGIMLRSYTRAVNNKEKRTGALFREETKAINLSKPEYVTPEWFSSFGITRINIQNPEKQYPNICFNYINNNPVKGGLIQKPEDWEFSSYRDIIGKRKSKLVNIERIKELGLVII